MKEILNKYRDISGFTRYEYKYLIKPEQARQIAEFLAPYLEVDKYAESDDGNLYTVRSLYYDSPDFKCHYEKIAGLSNREKFRLRTYNYDHTRAPIFLESKRKNCRKGMKDRVLVDKEMFKAIIDRDHTAISSTKHDEDDIKVIDRFFFHIFRRAYFPVLLVVYDREPYICPYEERVRITFDKNLRAMSFPHVDDIFNDSRLEPIIGDRVVLEIKFDHHLPRWVGDLTTIFGITPQACSKYCTGIKHFLGEHPDIKDGFRYV